MGVHRISCLVVALLVWIAALAPSTASAVTIASGRVMRVPVRTVAPAGIPMIGLHAPYAETVHTLPGFYQGISQVAYDVDDNELFMSQGGQLSSVSRTGVVRQLDLYSGTIGGIVYDSATKLVYVTVQSLCEVVSVVPASGVSSVLAGGTCGENNGQGGQAQFRQPMGITMDTTGQNLYVADKDDLRAVTVGGAVMTVTSVGGLATGPNCQFGPHTLGIAYDPDNASVYVADSCSEAIEKAVVRSGNVTTVVGQCSPNGFGFCLDRDRDGSGANALVATPASIEYNPVDHKLYFADTNNNQIRRMDTSGTVSTFAGSGHAEFRDGVGSVAGINGPTDLSVNSNGLLYVADAVNGLIRTVVTSGPPAPPPAHGVQLLDPPAIFAQPLGLTTTPDGSVWYTAPNVAQVVQVASNGSQTTYSISGTVVPQLLTTDRDGNIWFSFGGSIGRFETSGTLTAYPIPTGGNVTDMIGGADGNIWFVTDGNQIGSMTPTGSFIEYPTDLCNSLVSGFHSDYWTMGQNLGAFVDDVSSTGVVLRRYQFQNNDGSRDVYPMIQGPDRHIWIGQPQAIGEILSNTVLMYQLPPAPTFSGWWVVGGLVEGTDRALWFTSTAAGYVGRMTPSGLFTPYEIPTARSGPTIMVRTTSGAMWFVDPGSYKIGRWF